MPRRSRDRRERYMRDRADRRRMRRDYDYDMDYRNDYAESRINYDKQRNRDRYIEGYFMDNERPRKSNRDYYYDDLRDYRRGRDYRDYAENDYDEEYHEDLEKWTKKLKKYDRFGLSKEQVTQKAKEMKVNFDDYDEDEFYAIYLMHVSDYPTIANEPHTYLAMAKAWLEDKDINIDPSEKVCKYMYEIVMAE